MPDAPSYAFVTLVTSDHYLPGALVVAAALRDIHPPSPEDSNELDPSEFHIVCLVTPETVDISTIKQLRQAFDVVVGVEVIEQNNEEGLRLLGRPDLRLVLTKLHVFRLTSYRKIIFMDADMLPVKPISHLFHLSSAFAAVPDVGWPDIFNSGLMVLEPGQEKFDGLMDVVKAKGSWDGGDQGVLNEWVGSNWHRLSFTYNTTPTAIYTYAPAYKRYGSQIRNVHFIGPEKPWRYLSSHTRSTSGESSRSSGVDAHPPSYDYPALLNKWFSVYDNHYTPSASEVIPAITISSPINNPNISQDPISQRYDNIWDDKGQQKHFESSPTPKPAPFTLDELKKLATEGSGKTVTAGDQDNYVSLPLEGRVDLISPRRPPVLKEIPQITRVLASEGPRTPVRSTTPMQTLPTPGPNELPPAPSFRGGSLPPETPTYANSGSSFHFNLDPQSSIPTTPVRRSSGRASPPLLLWNPAVEEPPSSVPSSAANIFQDTYFHNAWDGPTQLEETRNTLDFFHIPEPPPIPEMLLQEGHYKAVIGDSPLQGKSQSNPVYSPSPIHQLQKRGLRGRETSAVEESTSAAASPLQLPARYIKEHVDMEEKSNVEESPQSLHPGKSRSHNSFGSIEQDQSPSYPRPDRSKVAPVFPWEQKPRQTPKRLFPQTDSPPPVFASVKSPSPPPPSPPSAAPPSLMEIKSRAATRVFPSDTHPIPSQDFPRTTMYENAWDTIPSIQKYATRLVNPTSHRQAVGPTAGHSRKGSKGSVGRWDERIEESSRDADADDEDEDDDDPSPHGSVSQSARSSKKVIHSKTYKTVGVQTMPKLTKNQFVQVPIEDFKRHRSSSRASRRESLSRSISFKGNKPGAGTGTPPDSPRISSVTANESSPQMETLSVAPRNEEPTGTPSPTSSLSSANILPLHGHAYKKQRLPPKRKFDPARDVELFKKGSEEVLARFLKMDSWDNQAGAESKPQ